jgi:hypothetical protein
MARFTIKRSPAGSKHAYEAKGKNPKTGRTITIKGGIKGVTPGPKAQGKAKAQAFDKRHGNVTSPKKWINKRRWNKGSMFGKTVNIPNNLF